MGGEVAGRGMELQIWRKLVPSAETRHLLLAVYNTLSRETAWLESWEDRCLDPGLQQWWALPTAMGRTSVDSRIKNLRTLERAAWCVSGDSWMEKTGSHQSVVTDSLEIWPYLINLGRVSSWGFLT